MSSDPFRGGKSAHSLEKSYGGEIYFIQKYLMSILAMRLVERLRIEHCCKK